MTEDELTTTDGAEDRVRRMTESLGFDLAAAVRARFLAPSHLAHFHRTCATCAQPADCCRRLDSAPQLSEPPGYCKNRRMLRFLRDHLPRR